MSEELPISEYDLLSEDDRGKIDSIAKSFIGGLVHDVPDENDLSPIDYWLIDRFCITDINELVRFRRIVEGRFHDLEGGSDLRNHSDLLGKFISIRGK